MPKVSVITPVYNVKQFVEKCVTSLMSQTFNDIEFIFVDDASTDGSIPILQSRVSKHPEKNIRVIHHEKNSGLPASRKTGFEVASGEFIFNCDGDDWVDPMLVEKMVRAVEKNDADYAYCDFFLTYKNSERYMKCPEFHTPDDALRKGYLAGTMKYNVWNKLIHRTLYDGVVFPVDHKKGGEDLIMLGILSKAKKIAYVPEALYHYVKTNTSAISETFSEQRLIDIRYNADTAIRTLETYYHADLSQEIAYFKLNVKLPFLITDDEHRYRIWDAWYPEANSYAMKNTSKALRIRILEWMASHRQWWYVKCHYKIIYGIVYRILYQ